MWKGNDGPNFAGLVWLAVIGAGVVGLATVAAAVALVVVIVRAFL